MNQNTDNLICIFREYFSIVCMSYGASVSILDLDFRRVFLFADSFFDQHLCMIYSDH